MVNKNSSSLKGIKKQIASKGMTKNDKADFRKSRKILNSVVAESKAVEVKAKTVAIKKTSRVVKTKHTFSGQPTVKAWLVLTDNSISAMGYNQLKKGEMVRVIEYPSDMNYALAQSMDGREALVWRGSYRGTNWK